MRYLVITCNIFFSLFFFLSFFFFFFFAFIIFFFYNAICIANMISFLYLVTDIAGITLLRTQILFTITTYIEIVVYVGMS